MKTRPLTIVKLSMALGILTGMLAQPATAERGHGPPGVEPGPRYDHASTVPQGFLDGFASVVRAMGLYNHNTAIAQAYRQAALRQYLKNRERYLDDLSGRKRRWKDAYGYQRRRTPAQAARIQQRKLPPRLEPWQLDAETGRVAWPNALLADDFANMRRTIEEALAQRTATNCGRGSRCHQNIKQAALVAREQLDDKLRSKEISVPIKCAAERFLKSVRYEAQQPLVISSASKRLALR